MAGFSPSLFRERVTNAEGGRLESPSRSSHSVPPRLTVSPSRDRQQIGQLDAFLVERFAYDHAIQIHMTAGEFIELHHVFASTYATTRDDAKRSSAEHRLLRRKIRPRQ